MYTVADNINFWKQGECSVHVKATDYSQRLKRITFVLAYTNPVTTLQRCHPPKSKMREIFWQLELLLCRPFKQVFTLPHIISSTYMYVAYYNYNTIMREIFVKCGRAGDQAKICKPPAKCGRIMVSLTLVHIDFTLAWFPPLSVQYNAGHCFTQQIIHL